jgi:beta-galactosidase
MDQVVRAAGITPAGLPRGVEVISRRTGDTRYRFILNHTTERIGLPYGGLDLVTGEPAGDQITVPAGGWAVLRNSTAPTG